MDTEEYFRKQVERCRRLARGVDPRTEHALLSAASDYEAEAEELARKARKLG